MTAEALLVSEPRDAHDHRVGELALREEWQGCRLPPQLVLGVVEIGEELDLGDRRKPVLGHADGEAEDGLLVQERVDHPVGAEPLHQFLRDAIDAALAAHVFAHERDIGVLQHQVGERPVDEAAHRLRLDLRFQVAAEDSRAIFSRRAVRGGTVAFRRDEAGHHLIGGGEARAPGGFRRDTGHSGAGFVIDRKRIVGGQRACFGQQAHGMKERIVRLVPLHLRLGQIRCRHIGPGVTVKADGPEMQEGGFAAAAHV